MKRNKEHTHAHTLEQVSLVVGFAYFLGVFGLWSIYVGVTETISWLEKRKKEVKK